MKSTAIFVAAILLSAAMSGCATPLDQSEESYQTFPNALSACRQQQPHRHGQKYRLPPTHPKIAACLKRHGWRTDGSRLDITTGT